MKEEALLTWVKVTSDKDEQGEVIREGAFVRWDGETVNFVPREFLPATVHHQEIGPGWEAELVIGPDGKPAYVNLTPSRGAGMNNPEAWMGESAYAFARKEQRRRFMEAYPEYWVNLEGIPIDRFSGKCTCRPIPIDEIQTIIVGGEDDCPVHGFGPGG